MSLHQRGKSCSDAPLLVNEFDSPEGRKSIGD